MRTAMAFCSLTWWDSYSSSKILKQKNITFLLQRCYFAFAIHENDIGNVVATMLLYICNRHFAAKMFFGTCSPWERYRHFVAKMFLGICRPWERHGQFRSKDISLHLQFMRTSSACCSKDISLHLQSMRTPSAFCSKVVLWHLHPMRMLR